MLRQPYTRLCFLYLSCLVSFACLSQEPVMKNFTVKDGLPSSEVYFSMQDSKGYMWFCTDGGVSRFDGYAFHNYSSQDGLKDNTVFGCIEDNKGKIWFRTLSGRLFYFEDDSIYGIPANDRITTQVRNGVVNSVYVDSGDTIWAGISPGVGYFKIAPPYRGIDFSIHNLEVSRYAYFMEIDQKGYIWGRHVGPRLHDLQADSTFLYSYRQYTKSGSFTKKRGPFSQNTETKYLRSHSGDYFITGFREVFKTGKNESVTLPGTVISVFEDSHQDVWVGQFRHGTSFFTGGKLSGMKPGHLLGNVSVSSIAEDREGGFWFSSLEMGVYYMTSRDMLYYDKSRGLSDNKVLTLVAGANNTILAATENGAISVVSHDSILGLVPGMDLKQENTIYRLAISPVKGEIIVGARWAFSFGIGHPFHPDYLLERTNKIAYNCFANDKKGNLWAGNYMSLDEVDPVTRKVLGEYNSKSRILSLCCGAGDTVWVGCVNGLWNFKDGLFRYQGNKYPSFTSRIEDLKLAADGIWWFATKGDGIIVKSKTDVFRITERNGLSSNICKSICIDSAGIVWVSTNHGISRIEMKKWKEYQITICSADDGLLTNEINQIIRTGNQVWAATNLGLITFDATKFHLNETPPPIYLTHLDVNSRKRSFSDTLHLKYFENLLQINFIGLSYMRNSKLRYKYMLDGLDTTWNYSQQNGIQYTILPPGKYCFKVYAINSAGVSSKKPAELYFTISKPFWREWWFILPVTILLLAITLTIINYRINKLRKVAVEKSDITRKMVELKLVALRAQMNPHFIFNSINSIQLFILKNDTESAHKHLSRFSKLMRQVLENSRHEFITLEKELSALELYVELERLRFSYKFHFTVSKGEGVEPEHVLIAPLILQPYIENAIWHGLMHLENSEGQLLLRIEIHGEMLKCIIEDNGIGLKKSIAIKKDSSHRSAGTSLNKERVETINSLNKSKLSVEFIDKINPDGSPGGTRVEVFLPYLRSG
jgi:ligand-binding sensor domain-containing protein